MFSLYVLDKALFYRKQLGHIEQHFFNQGVHLKTVSALARTGIEPVGVFIGGSLVRYWFLPHDLPMAVSNQGGLEEKISVDFQKLTNGILGSGIDYLFINSGFCEIHTAVNTGRDVNAVIKNNMQYMKKITDAALADGITPVITTLSPVRPAFVFPAMKWVSRPSQKKQRENAAIQEYNQLLRQYAADRNLDVIDFEKALENEEGLLQKQFSVTDGEHLDIAGYARLNSVFKDALAALDQARAM
ncbi:MAG: hypothetical protein LC657_12795 [Desulfobacteraceae bacterium]|nr:hypothetical protein [Desulfobacteraceae bacterium]